MAKENKASQPVKNLVFVSPKPVSVSADGQGFKVVNTDEADLIFLQIVEETEGEVRATPLSSFRMRKQGMIALKNAIDEAIAQMEPKKAGNELDQDY